MLKNHLPKIPKFGQKNYPNSPPPPNLIIPQIKITRNIHLFISPDRQSHSQLENQVSAPSPSVAAAAFTAAAFNTLSPNPAPGWQEL
jgi:hypothetical protein